MNKKRKKAEKKQSRRQLDRAGIEKVKEKIDIYNKEELLYRSATNNFGYVHNSSCQVAPRAALFVWVAAFWP